MKRSVAWAASLVAALVLAAGTIEAQSVQRFVRYEQGGVVSWGELVGSTIYQLTDAPYLGGRRTGASVDSSQVHLKAPVDPQTVYMTALNFRSHIQGEPAPYPGIFIVPANSIIGPGEDMVRPKDSQNFHYEAEAVVVIGKRAVNVPLEEAHEYVFGVTAGNDGSERAWQARDIQWTRAKGSRTFNAVGPVLVTGLDYENLDIEGRLNGERVQGENTSDMIYGINYMVHYISQYFTLEPGDLIWTGTMGQTRAMEPGDVYEVEVEGVGVLRNQVVQGM
ncbi:MAG TPA: fumarylacetoacetate hydrolase family protein [Longimicrobiales bacterium]|nr:fumarylacetoacetate hydrolase family protein [Longimicrobiales bacterium]